MSKEKVTFITNVKIFDGERVIDKQSVTIKGEKIINVGGAAPDGAEIIDAEGCTLLPGLIDAHSHPNMDALKMDLTFGVTTTCQMQGYFSEEQIKAIKSRHDVADTLITFFAVTAPDGHPNELLPPAALAQQKAMMEKMGLPAKKTASNPEEATAIVAERVEQGADYIKIMVEDGTVFGHPDTSDLSDEVIATRLQRSTPLWQDGCCAHNVPQLYQTGNRRWN